MIAWLFVFRNHSEFRENLKKNKQQVHERVHIATKIAQYLRIVAQFRCWLVSRGGRGGRVESRNRGRSVR